MNSSSTQDKNGCISDIFCKLKNCLAKEAELIRTREGQLSRKKYYFSVFLLFLFSVVIFYPGAFSNDPVWQWDQAVKHSYSTWHPILMAVIWHYLGKIFGIGAFFMFNQLLYWFSMALFVDMVLGRRLRYLALAFFPPTLIMSIDVWKDVACMNGLLLSVGFFLAWLKAKNKWYIVLAVLSLLYASLVRTNGFIPSAALIAMAVFFFGTWRIWGRLCAAFLGAVLFCALMMGSQTLLIRAFNAKVDHVLPSLLVWDIAGTYINAGIRKPQPLSVPLTSDERSEKWLDSYGPRDQNTVNLCKIDYKRVDDEVTKAIAKDWFAVVTEHPKAYLKHRLAVVKLLWSWQPKVYYPYQSYGQNHRMGKDYLPGPVGDKLFSRMHQVFHMMEKCRLVHVWVWMLISLGSVIFVIFRGIGKGASALQTAGGIVATSGLANAISLFFISPAADYRYVIWTVLAGLLSLVLITAGEIVRKSGITTGRNG